MDISWISDPLLSKSYKKGVEDFLNFVSQKALKDGKMDCPCSSCRNRQSLKRRTVRKHLLKRGFNSGCIRWVCDGEIDTTSGRSGLTEKNEGDFEKGNTSKSTEDSAGLPNYPKEEVKNIEEKDQVPDQMDVLFSEEMQDFEPNGKKSEVVAETPHQTPDDRDMLFGAICLYNLRKKFGRDRAPFDELIKDMVDDVWNEFGVEDINLFNTEHGKIFEIFTKAFEEWHFECYDSGQELQKSEASTSSSSQGGNN